MPETPLTDAATSTAPTAAPAAAAAGRTAIVVPCFNESAIIQATLDSLCAWFPTALIVAMDDGSTDDTWAKADASMARQPRVRAVRLPANAGKGAAVAAAAPVVTGHAVVIVDADLAYGRETIQRAIDALEVTDVAIGSRRHDDSTYTVPIRLFGFLYRRHLLGYLFNWLVRGMLGLTARDTQCGLKAFRAHAFQDVMGRLTTAGFAFDLEVLLLARGLGLRVREIPVDVTMDTGRSSVRLVRDGIAALQDVRRLAIRRLRGAYRPPHR